MTNLYFPFKALKVFLVISLFTLFSIKSASAQEVEEHLFYYSNELNIGNFVGFNGDLNYIYNENISAKIGVVVNVRRSPDEPADYTPGLFGVLTLGLADAYEVMQGVNLQVGKIYYLNSKHNTRVNAAIGIGFTSMHTIENWQYNTNSSLGSNYSYDLVKKNVVSVIISPKLEIPLGRVFGFTVSPTAIINSESNYYGIGLGYMIGIIRSKPVRN